MNCNLVWRKNFLVIWREKMRRIIVQNGRKIHQSNIAEIIRNFAIKCMVQFFHYRSLPQEAKKERMFLHDIKKNKIVKVPPRFELGSQDSES